MSQIVALSSHLIRIFNSQQELTTRALGQQIIE